MDEFLCVRMYQMENSGLDIPPGQLCTTLCPECTPAAKIYN